MPLSSFAQYVKDNYHDMAKRFPGARASEYMKTLAGEYRHANDLFGKQTNRKPRQKEGARSCSKSFSAKCAERGKVCRVNAKRRSCTRSPSPKRSPAAALAFRVRRSPSRR